MSRGGSTRAHRRWRAYVLERDGYRCRVPSDEDPERPCGAFADHADHVVPVAEGGHPLDPDNGRAACAFHNLSRGARTDEQARASRIARKISRGGPLEPLAGPGRSREDLRSGWSW